MSDEWHSQSQEKCIYSSENPQSTKMMRKVIKSHVLGVDTSMWIQQWCGHLQDRPWGWAWTLLVSGFCCLPTATYNTCLDDRQSYPNYAFRFMRPCERVLKILMVKEFPVFWIFLNILFFNQQILIIVHCNVKITRENTRNSRTFSHF